MTIDIAAHIGAVTRSVANRDHEGRAAHVVTATQTYKTSPEDLWDAITSAERLPRWFLPVSGDLKPGGRYQLQGNAGGTILVCDPPRHLKVTWEFGGAVSWVDVRIESANGAARLTLEHLMFDDDHWQQFGPGATGVGWDLTLVGLDRHIGGELKSADEGMKWLMSDEGKAFVRESSEAWLTADLAGGENPEQARAAAARTTTAYTGG